MGVALEQTTLKFHTLLVFYPSSSFRTEVQDSDGIVNNSEFYFVVKWAICGERRHLVDFDKRWLKFVINHDVEAEDLETERIVHIIGVACFEQMIHMRLRHTQGLHDNVVNFAFDTVTCH